MSGQLGTLAQRGGVCQCGGIEWSIIFGVRRAAYFRCGKCGARYDLNGVPMAPPNGA